MAGFALLIRGFGVRVPGGACLIKALTWCFLPSRGHFHVHCGRMWDPGGIYGFGIVILFVAALGRSSRCVADVVGSRVGCRGMSSAAGDHLVEHGHTRMECHAFS